MHPLVASPSSLFRRRGVCEDVCSVCTGRSEPDSLYMEPTIRVRRDPSEGPGNKYWLLGRTLRKVDSALHGRTFQYCDSLPQFYFSDCRTYEKQPHALYLSYRKLFRISTRIPQKSRKEENGCNQPYHKEARLTFCLLQCLIITGIY